MNNLLGRYTYLDHPDAVRRLLDGLKDRLDGIRIEASAGLIRVPGQEVARELLRLAKDPNSRVRRNVAQGLTGRVEPEMVPALAKLATDPADANIRFRAAKALAGLPGPQTDAILAKLLNDPKGTVRNLARRLLTTRGQEAPLAPELATEVRHPEDQLASCKESFLGGGSSGPEAWRKFLGRVASVEGAPSGSTEGVPAVVFTTRKGSHAALLPFGPVQWIGLAVTLPLPGRGRKKPPRLDYALLGAKEAKAWMQSLGVEALLKGEDLAQRLGWL